MTRGDVGHARRPTSRRCAAHAPASCELYRAAAEREIDLAEDRGALAPERADRRTAIRTCKAGLTGTIAARWSTASPPSTRPGRRPDSSVRRPGPASGGSASAPPASFRRAERARPCCAGPTSAPLARLRGGLARDPPAPVRRAPRAAGRGRRSRCTGPAPGAPGRRAAPAPPRRRGAPEDATATSAGGIVVRYRRTDTPARRRAAAGASATAGPGRSQGHARTPARRPSRRRSARSREETGLEVRITGPLDSIEYWFVQSAARGSTRPSTTS